MSRHSSSIRLALLILMVSTISAASYAQSEGSRFGAEAKVSTNGIGGEGAFRIVRRINVRAGYSAFNFDHSFTKDGVTYGAKLDLRSMTANVDLYLIGPLHISPGALLYNGFKVSADAAVAPGNTFTLGGTTYESGSANPLHGVLALTVPKAAPELLIGLGNLVPRSGRHLTVNFDTGVVFQGSLSTTLALTGQACAPPNTSGPTCLEASTNATVTANVVAQQIKLNNDLRALKYYPVVSFGIGWHF